ncbi:hypothetical protein VP01_1540g3 [Puccinia sorghi]|uniref:Uncharacterized protein n=1 Tax=Puccinia sorghi TaxID=27349 RepID=A0A0L6VK80_9BASI|nr:hypothetical protein VP01_1540g3 [Puccinia sorghi]
MTSPQHDSVLDSAARKRFEIPFEEYEQFDPSAGEPILSSRSTYPQSSDPPRKKTVLALASAGLSMVLQQHLLAWLSLFFSVTSILNNSNRAPTRSSSTSPLQGLMFSFLALTTLCKPSLLSPSHQKTRRPHHRLN